MSDCNASMGRTGDTESEVTRRQTPNAPLITPWASHHHPQATGSPCIQALKLRNAMRVPAWSAFICSPEPAEGRGTAGMAAEGWLAWEPSRSPSTQTTPQRSNLAPCARVHQLRACTDFSEWPILCATPPSFLTNYMIFTPKSGPDRRHTGDSYFIVMQQESASCVTALQYAHKTRISLRKQHQVSLIKSCLQLRTWSDDESMRAPKRLKNPALSPHRRHVLFCFLLH